MKASDLAVHMPGGMQGGGYSRGAANMISSSGEATSQNIQMPTLSVTNQANMMVMNKQDAANVAETDPSLSKLLVNSFPNLSQF